MSEPLLMVHTYKLADESAYRSGLTAWFDYIAGNITRPPEWMHARTTLMWMGSLLGVMFLGLSYLAVQLQVVPTETKTVIVEV
jgi:hypothetical protein